MQPLTAARTAEDFGLLAAPPPRSPGGPLDADPLFRKVFFDSPQAMWLIDSRTQRFIEANAAAIRLYGYSRSEFLGMSLADLRAGGPAGRTNPERAARKATALFHPDQRHRAKSGSEIAVDLHSWLLHRGGDVRLVMVNEVTDFQNAVSLLCRHWHHMAGLLAGVTAS